MSTGAWALQTGVYARLTGDAALMGLVTGVHDETPETATMPYLVFGTAAQTPDDGHDRQGLDVELTLHIWSQYRGYQEAALILREVDRLLDRPASPLSVDGFENVSIAQQSNQFTRDPNPRLRHVVVTYRVWMTEPAPAPLIEEGA